jgi:hypothetical protein
MKIILRFHVIVESVPNPTQKVSSGVLCPFKLLRLTRGGVGDDKSATHAFTRRNGHGCPTTCAGRRAIESHRKTAAAHDSPHNCNVTGDLINLLK